MDEAAAAGSVGAACGSSQQEQNQEGEEKAQEAGGVDSDTKPARTKSPSCIIPKLSHPTLIWLAEQCTWQDAPISVCLMSVCVACVYDLCRSLSTSTCTRTQTHTHLYAHTHAYTTVSNAFKMEEKLVDPTDPAILLQPFSFIKDGKEMKEYYPSLLDPVKNLNCKQWGRLERYEWCSHR